MKMKKVIGLALIFALVLSFAGCGNSSGAKVYVQSVAQLSGFGGIAAGDRFAGVVVAENTVQIPKDEDKAVYELLVKEGDDVTEGQTLFTYDTAQLQLNLDKQRLELQQLEASIENYKQQIRTLEKEHANAPSSEKLQYTVQIQTVQLDLQEAELNLEAKKTEVAQAEAILENAAVVAPISGRILSINENGYDNYGNPLPYITIQQAGSYRVKGTLGELQMGVIYEGVRIQITSRTDESLSWGGTVSYIDYENPSQGNPNDIYYGQPTDEMTTSSNYPFYVELDSTDGLLLGQHVYLELETAPVVFDGVSISSAFICYEEDGTSYVWADRRGSLEKRTVTLGEYDFMNDTYQILSGLDEDDYIAFPDPELCVEGASTMKEQNLPQDSVVMPESGVF